MKNIIRIVLLLALMAAASTIVKEFLRTNSQGSRSNKREAIIESCIKSALEISPDMRMAFCNCAFDKLSERYNIDKLSQSDITNIAPEIQLIRTQCYLDVTTERIMQDEKHNILDFDQSEFERYKFFKPPLDGDFLKEIYIQNDLSDNGTFEEFWTDMMEEEVQKSIYLKYIDKNIYPSFETFQKDLYTTWEEYDE